MHIGIVGNKAADKTTKWALTLHEITKVPAFPKTIPNPFRAFQKEQNTELRRPKYCKTLTRSECILLARLRVGRTTFNTNHYYERTGPAVCSFCNETLTLHIFSESVESKIDAPQKDMLDCITKDNLPLIMRCLRIHNIVLFLKYLFLHYFKWIFIIVLFLRVNLLRFKLAFVNEYEIF